MPSASPRQHVALLSANVSVTNAESNGAANFPMANQEPGRLGLLELHGTTLAGGAASVTVRGFRDSALDQEVIPATTKAISVGKTTATKWSCSINIDAPWPGGCDQIYFVIKTDAGTLTLVAADSRLVWQE